MLLRRFILVIFGIFLITSILYAEAQNIQESEQQINDFSLSGYGEKAQKTWDLSAKTADIFDNNVKLKEIVGNLYGEKEDIKLTADKGDFDKQEILISENTELSDQMQKFLEELPDEVSQMDEEVIEKLKLVKKKIRRKRK
jgi:hypothetical protein